MNDEIIDRDGLYTFLQKERNMEVDKIIDRDGLYGVTLRQDTVIDACMDCANNLTHGNLYQWIERGNEVIDYQDNDVNIVGVWHADLMQYETFLGELIPLEGVYCALCESEIIAPVKE